MEVMQKRSPVVKKERRAEAAGSEEGDADVVKFETEASCRHDGQRSNSSSPEQKDLRVSKQDEQLESTRVEMGEVKQENERLKMILARITKDYQSLQMHFFDIVHQEPHQKPAETTTVFHQETDESELVSLCLGTSSGGPHKHKEEKAAPNSTKAKVDERTNESLSLSLDCNFDRSSSPGEPQQNSSGENSSEDQKEEEAAGPWSPSKILKTQRSGDDEVSQQAHVKKARVSVRARCDAPTMNDGCHWRKYGQKIAKGNPCPRAYYRCTVAPACPVRKQVQRCAEDTSILITTYEGTHNHPLPISATAMASTTSAAARMLISGSSVSHPAIGVAAMTASAGADTGGTSLHGLNFSLSDVSRQRQLYLPTPSSITSSPSYPTITLDLTSPPSSSSPSTQFGRFPSNFFSSTARYGPTSFNFSTSEATTAPASWSSGYLSYGSTQPYNTKNQLGYFNLGRQPQEQLYQSHLQKPTDSAAPPTNTQSLNDTIAAATKAITADPSFQSALAAAITSIVGGQGTHGVAETAPPPGHANLKRGEQLSSSVSPFTSSANGNGCASSFLSRSTSSNPNPQQATLLFPQSSLGISGSKSASASPVHNREQIN